MGREKEETLMRIGLTVAIAGLLAAGLACEPRAEEAAMAAGGGEAEMRLELQPGQWINSEPLTLAGLRGRVVLVDFWDYTCVNCLRTLPYLQEWYKRYQPYGFVIVGVHTPEFEFAKDYDRLKQATERLGVTWPVLLDNDYATWNEFGNRYWPHHYLFDATGKLVYDHVGEGGYGHTEEQIQKALRAAGVTAEFPAVMEPVRETDQPGAVCYRVTPETYLGRQRGRIGNPGGYQRAPVGDYVFPPRLQRDLFYLAGKWLTEGEYVAPSGTGAHLLRLPYRAQSVNLVLKPPAEGKGRLTLLLDGKPLSQEHYGADVKPTETGQAEVTVGEGRMYNLVNSPGWGEHTLEISFETPGTEAFAFTFGSACVE